MHTYTISRSHFLCAQSRRNRVAFQHVIETTRQAIKNSERLIERATQTCDSGMISSARPAKADLKTDKE